MTLKALRRKPTHYSVWQKLAMTMGCFIVLFLGGPFVAMGFYMLRQGTFLGMVFGIALIFVGVCIALWSLALVFRVWGNRWPWKKIGEPIL